GDVRLPTGEAMNLLGSGAAGVHPFVAISYPVRRFAPRVNYGYQWNGRSILAGDPNINRKGDLPDAFTFSGGVDFVANRHLTLSGDLLGQHLIGATRVVPVRYTDALGRSFPETRLEKSSLELVNGAIGAKLNLTHTLLLTGNAIFRLNDAGLRARVVPLIGISWAF